MKMMRLVWHSFTHAPDDSIFDVLADCTCSILVILRTSICRLDSAVEKITQPSILVQKKWTKTESSCLITEKLESKKFKLHSTFSEISLW